MRKLALIAAMVLVSATAQAGQSRSLIVAAAEDQPTPVSTTEQPPTAAPVATQSAMPAAPVEAAKPAEVPKYVERPALQPTAPSTDSVRPAKTVKAEKPKSSKQRWTEDRIISELHHHGIYW